MKKNLIFILLAMLCLNFWARGQSSTIKGKVITVDNVPLHGATVREFSSTSAVQTNKDGNFTLTTLKLGGILTISFLGYETKTMRFSSLDSTDIIIRLLTSKNSLDEVQIIGYGQTTKRLNTGSVSAITSKDIERQPVTNVISALSGRMTGVQVSTANGLPGGGISLQIRGKGSISAGTEPLYIIDNVPYPSTSLVSNTALGNGITGAINPLNSLSPNDIENITVLKDADATAIYGSRGANGVVLITTKRGKLGKAKVNIDFSKGFSKVANLPELLNLDDYLDIRREAFANAGKVPSADPASANYAPDLTVWSQTSSTDWAKYVMGNTANTTNFYGAVSGGTESTSFNISGNYHAEGSVLSGENRYWRGGSQLSMQHVSPNKKFGVSSSITFTKDNNLQANPVRGFAAQILLPPNYPIYDALGNLNFATGSNNPLAASLSSSEARSENIVFNTSARYEIFKGLNFKTNLGYNGLDLNQVLITPKASLSPAEGAASTTYFGNNSNQTLLIEPQIDYMKSFGQSKFNILIGGSWQESEKQSQNILATNFNSESMLKNLSSAATITPANSSTIYRYASIFGRITYSMNDKYIINGSIRRDGSSRFGPNNQYGTFGAMGAAWILTRERWINETLTFLSFAKLRASYGITGSDQITDYQYLSSYTSNNSTYQGITGLSPSRIANNAFRWEENKKAEFGLETGFFRNRLMFNINYFSNKSGNQLVNYTLPSVTGFSTYQANLPANVLNYGWEVEIQSKNLNGNAFRWETNFNLTVTRNRLLDFPEIESSSYSNTLRIGESIQRATGYVLTGLDGSGMPQFLLKNGDVSASPAFENSFFTIGEKLPRFYGGLGNHFSWKNFDLDIFAQFSKQQLSGGLTAPGNLTNNFAIAATRWQQPGDGGNIPRPSLTTVPIFRLSSANIFDASYIRIKNISFGYLFKGTSNGNLKFNSIRVYAQGQNIYTFWNRKAAFYDPETGAGTIPPLLTFNFGFQINF